MNVDLSRSIDHSFRSTLDRAGRLRAEGRSAEAAAVYREAARLARQRARYAVSRPEKARRLKRAEDLAALAEQVVDEKPSEPPEQPRRDDEELEDTGELQSQIDGLITQADVRWDDIGGLEETKQRIQLAFGMAVARKPQGVTLDVVNNVLLYGPPGTGKSLLAAAVSGGLHATFFNVRASELMSKWFGESSRLISLLYDTARRRAPSVVFIDELESLFPSRDGATSGPERRVLSTLLAELSGVSTSGESPHVFTIGATNAPWLMDTAALSRFGQRIYVPLPDPEARQSVLEIHLEGKGHMLDFPLDRLISATEGFSGRQLAHLAAAAVHKMVADSNPDLADAATRGDDMLEQYQIKTRPLQWSDVESSLSRMKPDTSPEALKRFETW